MESGSDLDFSNTSYQTDGTDGGSATGTDLNSIFAIDTPTINPFDWVLNGIYDGPPEHQVTYTLLDFVADMSPYSVIRYWKAPHYMSNLIVFVSQDVSPTISNFFPGNLTRQRIKEKIAIALDHLVMTPRLSNVLIQFWAPVMIGDKYYLKTTGQTFGLGQIDKDLCKHKVHSESYAYDLDGEENLGVPGRVFKNHWPEYTPNVNYYPGTEYPHSDLVDVCGIQRCFALPVYEPIRKNCLGVLELVDTNKGGQMENAFLAVHRALKAAKLESTYSYYDNGNTQNQMRPPQGVVEIHEMLRVVVARFPNLLAQVWVPCKRDVVASSVNLCCPEEVLSTPDMSMHCDSYPEMLRFHKRCREHLLKKGQGVVGKAAVARRPCFCSDITKFSTTDYPLTHYAQMSGLTSSFAVYLQSTSPENTNYYVVELFILPGPDDNASEVPKSLLGLILATMRRYLASFKFSSGEEPRDEISVEVINFLMNGNQESFPCQTSSLLLLQDEDLNSKIELSLEVLQQHFHMKLDDAANSLGVCRSTLKRACRQHDIPRWPTSKRDNVSRSPPNRHAKKFAQSYPKLITTSHSRVLSASLPPPDDNPSCSYPSSVRIKGIYGNEIIAFRLSLSSGIKGLKDNITRRLNLEDTSFKLKYTDEEGDLVLITCDDDLQNFVDCFTSLHKTYLRIMILPVA